MKVLENDCTAHLLIMEKKPNEEAFKNFCVQVVYHDGSNFSETFSGTFP